MQGKITSIKPQKKRKDRVNVYIDGEYGFSLPALSASELKKGESLSEARIEELKRLDKKDKAFQRAAAYLAIRPRSRAEIENYLAGRGFSNQDISEAVERLEGYGYINDRKFAEMWVESRTRHRPRGAAGLAWELAMKGVSREIVNEVLENFDEHDAGLAAVRHRLSRWKGLPDREIRKKINEFLKRRGFSSSTRRDICGEILDS